MMKIIIGNGVPPKKLISDFGMATQLNSARDLHTTMCGTPNFISPEVASHTPHGLETDVWSLGCMMYTFLVGSPPFDSGANKPDRTLFNVRRGEFTMPEGISLEAQDLLRQFLQKEPARRIKLAQVLAHPFMTTSSTTAGKSARAVSGSLTPRPIPSATTPSTNFSSSSSSLNKVRQKTQL